MDDFEELAKVAYPLWLGCIGADPSKWELTDEELEIVDSFVHRCIAIALQGTNKWQH